MYRNSALLEAARNAPCTFQIRGVCNKDASTSVWCHSNYMIHGKGKGVKAHDCFGAIGCSACHAWLDHGNAPYETKEFAFRSAMDATLLYLFTCGIIEVVGQSKRRDKPFKPLSKIVPRK